MSPEAAILEYIEKARAVLGDKTVYASCVIHKPWTFLEGKHFNTVVEIGTWCGLSAMVLAHYAEVVITIDTVRHPQLEAVLDTFGAGIRDRISAIHVLNDHDKRNLVRHLDFDFAFVDGQHTLAGCELDFLITKKCGSVLFHDYPCSAPEHQGVGLFVDSITEGIVEPLVPFAWWRAE